MATYYVSTTGSDAADGSVSTPWLTVQKACTTMMAGDTTYVRGGTYTDADITFGNSGTSGNVITLKNYPGETPIVDGGYSTSSGFHPTFLLDNVNYITFDGLTIQGGSRANIRVAENNATTNITIQNCVVRDFITDDNGSNIFLNAGSASITIVNNVIQGRILGGLSHNVGNGIIIFRTDGYTIRNNTIGGNSGRAGSVDLINGIYGKHDTAGLTNPRLITKNLIVDNDESAFRWTMHSATISHNLCYGNLYGVYLFDSAGTCPCYDNTFTHNTFITGSNYGIRMNGPADSCAGAEDTIITNNIIGTDTGSTYRCIAVWPSQASDLSNTTLTYNLAYSSSFPAASLRVLNTNYSLLTPPVSVTASNNIEAAPTFVNAAGNDYRLTAGSQGHNAASDGTDMGAYGLGVTDIGASIIASSNPSGFAHVAWL